MITRIRQFPYFLMSRWADRGSCPTHLLSERVIFTVPDQSEFDSGWRERSRYALPWLCALFLLPCVAGCARRIPGETFSAGYIFSESQNHLTHDFVVTNTTSEPVRIRNIEKSCTCTSFKLGKYQLAPGETTTLQLDVDVTKNLMKKSATCYLVTDHPRFKKWPYTIHFTSLPFVVAEPSDLNLGRFTVDGKNSGAIQHATLDLFADSKIELTRDDFTVPDDLELTIAPNPEVRRLQRDVWNARYHLSVGLSPKGREAVLNSTQSGLITRTI